MAPRRVCRTHTGRFARFHASSRAGRHLRRRRRYHQAAHAAVNPATSPLNLIGKIEGLQGIGPATKVAEVSIKVSTAQGSQITGAQLKELLKLPEGMTFELNLEKEDD